MSAALKALHRAQQAGVRVMLEGGKVRLGARIEPPAEIVELLRENKFGVIALLREPPYTAALRRLEGHCPSYIEPERWQLALDDARRFIGALSVAAAALGWTEQDLFGLHTPPERPAANYSRLSRLDCTGLVWVLRGAAVTYLSSDVAWVATTGGAALRWPRRRTLQGGPCQS